MTDLFEFANQKKSKDANTLFVTIPTPQMNLARIATTAAFAAAYCAGTIGAAAAYIYYRKV